MPEERCVKCFRPLEPDDEGPLCAACWGEHIDGRDDAPQG